jgi:cytochrome c5
VTAEWVTRSGTGETRLLQHGPAVERRLNLSLAWRAIEAEKLAATPDCERCGEPAVEAHLTAGSCTVSPPYALADCESLCRLCHDATLCTAPLVTDADRWLRWSA